MFQRRTHSIKIGMVLFPSLSELEFMAPYGIFSYLPNAQIYRIGPTLEPIYSDTGFPLIPNTSFEKVPELDAFFVPGGLGVTAKLEDTEFLQFLQRQGERAHYVTSIGSGSLLLAAATLLRGHRATTDWSSLALLAMFGAEPVEDRIVVDRNRITASNLTDGLALGNAITQELLGNAIAQEAQLRLNYHPTLFTDSFPESLPSEIFARVRAEQQMLSTARLQVIQRITSTVSSGQNSSL